MSAAYLSRAEHWLLALTRAIGAEIAPAAVEPLLREPHLVPAQLRPAAGRLLGQAAARGLCRQLIALGGYRRAESLVNGQVKRGRLWERHQAPRLVLSPLSFELLLWLLETDFDDEGHRPFHSRRRPSLGDQLWLCLVARLLSEVGLGGTLGRSQVFRGSALCWLAHIELLSLAGPPLPQKLRAAFAELFDEGGSLLVEAFQDYLGQRWFADELLKEAGSLAQLRAIGEAQALVGAALLDALEAHQRADLAAFLWEATAQALSRWPELAPWRERLGGAIASLEQRSAAAEASTALLRLAKRLEGWRQAAGSVPFFEPDYPAAQLLLRQAEILGPAERAGLEGIIVDSASLAAFADEQVGESL